VDDAHRAGDRDRDGMRRILAGVFAVLLAAAVAACSSTSDTAGAGSSAPSSSASESSAADSSGSSADLCAAVTSLKASVDALKNVQLSTDGLPALQGALESVKTDTQRVVDAGKAQYQVQVTRLQADAKALQVAVDAAKAAPSAATLAAVRTAISTAGDDMRSVADDLGSHC
jgi:hypothetical protein